MNKISLKTKAKSLSVNLPYKNVPHHTTFPLDILAHIHNVVHKLNAKVAIQFIQIYPLQIN